MTVAEAQPMTNPLTRAADAVPEPLARVVSVAARVAGAALAFYYAIDQDYDRTQFVTVILGALVLLTLVPAGKRTGLLTALGGGLLLFGGTILVHEPAGVGMLAAGVVAWAAAAVWNRHRGDAVSGTVVGLFLGALVIVAVIVLVALTVEG